MKHRGNRMALTNRSHATAPGKKRRATIEAYIEREKARTGALPSVEHVAQMFAMSPARVAMHFRELGLL